MKEQEQAQSVPKDDGNGNETAVMEMKADTGTGGQEPPWLLFMTFFILQCCFTTCTVKTNQDFVPLKKCLIFSYCLSHIIKNSWDYKTSELIDNP